MDNLLIGFVVFFGSILLSRKISNDAMLKLENDKKVELIDLFTKKSSLNSIIIFAIILLFFVNLKFNFINLSLAYIIYCIFFLLYFFKISYNSYKKLRNNNFPLQYIKSYLISVAIKLVGMFVFFLLIGKNN